jgi:hypothetical protein
LTSSKNGRLDSISLRTIESLTQEIVIVVQKASTVTSTDGPTVYMDIDSCHEQECSTVNVSCYGKGKQECIQGTHLTECEIIYICDKI